MKIKYNSDKKSKKDKSEKPEKRKYPVRTEPLKEIYKNEKSFLKKSLEVIQVSVQEQLSSMFEDYKGWRRGKGKKPDYIFNMFLDIGFASIIRKIVKKNSEIFEENAAPFSEMLASAIGTLSRNRNITRGKEMIAIYSKLYEDWNETRIKKIIKLDLPNVDWDAALKLSIASHGSPKHTMNSVLRFMYTTFSPIKFRNYDAIYKLLKKLYGKEQMDKVSIYILLDRQYDKQKDNWVDRELYSVITNLALDELNSYSKDEIKDLLELYCEERRRTEFNGFINRRVNFSTINLDDYKKIDSVVKKLAEKNEMYKIFLDHSRVSIKPLRTPKLKKGGNPFIG